MYKIKINSQVEALAVDEKAESFGLKPLGEKMLQRATELYINRGKNKGFRGFVGWTDDRPYFERHAYHELTVDQFIALENLEDGLPKKKPKRKWRTASMKRETANVYEGICAPYSFGNVEVIIFAKDKESLKRYADIRGTECDTDQAYPATFIARERKDQES